LAEVTAALEIDPDFLAAHSLRDRILEPAEAPASAEPAALSPSVEAEPPLSAARYAKFEERAKRRRVDRRVESARAALERQQLEAAASALDEISALDPDLPELGELTARFDDLRAATATSPRGPRLVAAAVFVITVFAASWLQDSTALFSRPILAVAPLIPPLRPLVTVAEQFAMVATVDAREAISEPSTPDVPEPAAPAPRPVAEAEVAAAPPPAVVDVPVRPVALDVPVRPAAFESIAVAPAAAPVAPTAPIAALAAPPVAEDMLVRLALQRYRSAYDGLDAQSARAVWPAVNETALARAFDGLESQRLTFDACDIHVGAESATATCQGSARYVPKIGSREPRIEPRVWNFTLHKTGSEWTIDSARAQR